MNLLDHIKTILEQNESFCKDGRLFKNSVVEAALKLDPVLLKLLLADEKGKKYFFTDVDGIIVFDKVKFQKFVSNKEFLPDSFTAYKNKIGLTANGEYLTESNEVVLDFPYKDCVLEGGQTKEDQKRKEIFWNETLAPDEIDRLLEPKALTNWKKYDKDGEHTVDSVSVDNNLLIKGNNLLALHSLLPKYKGRVKLIYIDPPYNTGNDGFQYNDSFNHSSWLTFMKNRLEVSLKLLSAEGSIYISIDENEIGYLKILLDKTFGRSNHANLIAIKRGSVTGHKAINPGVVNISEYLLVYAKNKTTWKPNKVYSPRHRNDRYNQFISNYSDNFKDWKICTLLEALSKHLDIPKSKLKKTLGANYESEIYSFVKDNANSVVQMAYPDKEKISADLKELIIKSLDEPTKVFLLKRDKQSDIFIRNGQRLLFYSDRLMMIDGELVTAEPMSDLWLDVLPNDLHNEGGVKFKKGKKPEKLIKRILELASKEGDIVLDFHLGSGTTACVALKMKRRFIGIEQMDYGNNDSTSRLVNSIKGEQAGISKAMNWKGGGSFVYAELAQDNAGYIDSIQAAKKSKALIKIWNEIKDKGFISYKVSPKDIDDSISEFSELSLEDQKKLLISLLDKNQLYVNYSDMEDGDHQISKEDQALNHQFYQS